MATYELNQTKSNGTTNKIGFTIPNEIGKYRLTFTTSDNKSFADDIIVDGNGGTYQIAIKKDNGETISANIELPVLRQPFSTASWDYISTVSANGTAKSVFSVGDEKDIMLSTGEIITVVILGFDHDDLSDGSGKAGITIGMKNCLETKYPINKSATSKDHWDSCTMRTTTMATLFSQLPSDLQNVIRSVDKKATSGGSSQDIIISSDELFLLSAIEITGDTISPGNLAGNIDEGWQYEYWRTVKDGTVDTDRIKYLGQDGSSFSWWLRSAFVRALGRFFYSVSSFGDINSSSATSNNLGVSFAFCV